LNPSTLKEKSYETDFDCSCKYRIYAVSFGPRRGYAGHENGRNGGRADEAGNNAGSVATADGTIKAIDTTKHTVTISHGAVPAVQWPPMTMAFSVTEDQLTGLTAGDRVSFSFRVEGGRATSVSIKK
jgi:Cu(I)/Ag(I) efflux system periplasmic protein CusF